MSICNSQYTLAEYREFCMNILPPGSAWARTNDTVLYYFITSFADELYRIDTQQSVLLCNLFPSKAKANSKTEFLTAWEIMLGLPDAANPALPATTSGRWDLIIERLVEITDLIVLYGANEQFFISLAALLGYGVITITSGVSVAWCGVATCGDTGCGGEETAFTWIANVPTPADATLIENMFEKFRPAHTILIFNYT